MNSKYGHLHTRQDVCDQTALENKQVSIYALQDPRDNSIKYIGKASNPDERLKRHLSAINVKSQMRGSDNYIGNCQYTRLYDAWMYSLWVEGLEPRLVILAQVGHFEAKQCERDFIEMFSTYGLLVNQVYTGIKQSHLDSIAKRFAA